MLFSATAPDVNVRMHAACPRRPGLSNECIRPFDNLTWHEQTARPAYTEITFCQWYMLLFAVFSLSLSLSLSLSCSYGSTVALWLQRYLHQLHLQPAKTVALCKEAVMLTTLTIQVATCVSGNLTYYCKSNKLCGRPPQYAPSL